MIPIDLTKFAEAHGKYRAKSGGLCLTWKWNPNGAINALTFRGQKFFRDYKHMRDWLGKH